MKRGRKRITLKPGAKYGKFTVSKDLGLKNGRSYSLVICECGNELTRLNSDIVRLTVRCKKCGKTSRLTDAYVAKRKKIVDLRKSGLSSTQIGAKLGLSRERVCQILRPLGLSKRLPIKPHRKADDIKRLILVGMTNKEIVAATGTTMFAVDRISSEICLGRGKRSTIRAVAEFSKTKKHNSLSLLRESTKIGHHVFLCDCGNEFEGRIGNVRSGLTRSCGCRKERYTNALTLGFLWDKEKGTILEADGEPVSGSPIHDHQPSR